MTFLEIAVALLPKTKTEAVTDAVALTAVTAPTLVNDIHGWLTIAFQVAGIAWLCVQIIVKIHTTYFRKRP